MCSSSDALITCQRTLSPRGYVSRSVYGHERPLIALSWKSALPGRPRGVQRVITNTRSCDGPATGSTTNAPTSSPSSVDVGEVAAVFPAAPAQ